MAYEFYKVLSNNITCHYRYYKSNRLDKHAFKEFFAENINNPWLKSLDNIVNNKFDFMSTKSVLIQQASLHNFFILPGRAEHPNKYDIMAQFFVALGFNVIIIDWQGQGENISKNFVAGHVAGHIENFNLYQEYLLSVIQHVEKIKTGLVNNFISHSMGGLIFLNSMEILDKNISDKQKGNIILISPCIRLNGNKFTLWLIQTFSLILAKSGLDKFKIKQHSNKEFSNNNLTNNKDVFNWCKELIEFSLFPTIGWVKELLKAQRSFKEKDVHDFSLKKWQKLEVFFACDDSVINPYESAKIIEKKFSLLNSCFFPDAKHELLFEKDKVRVKIIKKILHL